jgi:hypothetical protein
MNRKKQAFLLFTQGFRPGDDAVKKLKLAPKTTYNYFQDFKKTGSLAATNGNSLGPTSTVNVNPTKSTLIETEAAVETQLLKFVAHIQQVPMSVNIYVSYGCAVANGYDGSLGDWLSLISLDFWECRNRNMFQEFGGGSGNL